MQSSALDNARKSSGPHFNCSKSARVPTSTGVNPADLREPAFGKHVAGTISASIEFALVYPLESLPLP